MQVAYHMHMCGYQCNYISSKYYYVDEAFAIIYIHYFQISLLINDRKGLVINPQLIEFIFIYKPTYRPYIHPEGRPARETE